MSLFSLYLNKPHPAHLIDTRSTLYDHTSTHLSVTQLSLHCTTTHASHNHHQTANKTQLAAPTKNIKQHTLQQSPHNKQQQPTKQPNKQATNPPIKQQTHKQQQ